MCRLCPAFKKKNYKFIIKLCILLTLFFLFVELLPCYLSFQYQGHSLHYESDKLTHTKQNDLVYQTKIVYKLSG